MSTVMRIRHAAAVAVTVATCVAGTAMIPVAASADEMPLPAHWGTKHAGVKAPVVRSAHRQVRRVVAGDPPPPADGEAIPYGFHPEFMSGNGPDPYGYYAGSFHGGFHYRGIYWTQTYWGMGQWERWW
jgi:hypothetical protein